MSFLLWMVWKDEKNHQKKKPVCMQKYIDFSMTVDNTAAHKAVKINACL